MALKDSATQGVAHISKSGTLYGLADVLSKTCTICVLERIDALWMLYTEHIRSVFLEVFSLCVYKMSNSSGS